VDFVAVEKFLPQQFPISFFKNGLSLLCGAGLLAPQQPNQKISLHNRFMPTERAQCGGQKLRDLRLIAPCPADGIGRNCKIAEGRQDLVEFLVSLRMTAAYR
jgi:hypothetical protein